MTNIIEIKELIKVFNDGRKNEVRALDGVSMGIPHGVVFSLLGPNGAGKTTLVKILLGISYPTSGSIELFGENFRNIQLKKRIGYLPENHKFPPYLTGEKLLKYIADLYGYRPANLDKRIAQMLEIVEMSKWSKTKIKNYSKGMMQRLGLAQAILHNPELIILDEPTDGVDPIGRKKIRDLILRLKAEGKTIFVNSHLLSEVEMISDSIAILNKGKVVYSGTVDELTTQKQIYEITLNREFDDYIKFKLEGFQVVDWKERKFRVKIGKESELQRIQQILQENNYLLLGLNQVKTSLENEFISLIEKTGNENE